MSSFDWENFLRQWSQDILASMDDKEKQQLPQAVLDSGWLGYPGATEDQIARVEARLQRLLPPSYRAFLKVTNGWRQTAKQTDNFNHRLWSIEDIERFSGRHTLWIKAFTERHEMIEFGLDDAQEFNDHWEPVEISDEDYFVYGESQDPSKIRPEYLKTAIEISDVGVDSIYLLNPQVVTPDGEWEAWFFADYLPGADRYRSFREMMEAEYLSFLELQELNAATSQAATENDAQAISEPVVADESDLSLDCEPVGKLDAEGNAPSELPTETDPIVWKSLKRLTVEFQTRQVDDQAEYRTVVNPGGLSQPQAWPDLTEHKLRLWLRQNLAEVGEAHLDELTHTTVPTAASDTGLGLHSQVSSPDRSRAENIAPSPEHNVEESQGQEPPLEINLAIAQLALRQPSNPAAHIVVRPSTRQSRPVGIGSLSSQQPFSIEAEFHLAGQRMNAIAPQDIRYEARFFAQNRTTHQWVELGKTPPNKLESDRVIYKASLFNQTLKPGMYRMQVLTSLSGAAMGLSSFELPLLNVV